MKDIKWIFFDLGYTLIDEDQVWIDRCIKQSSIDNKYEWKYLFNKIKESMFNNSYNYKEIMKSLGYNEFIKYDPSKEVLYPDTINILEYLYPKYNLGIIANQVKGLNKRLEEFKILKYFKVIECSEELGFNKPDKRIFEKAIMDAKTTYKESIMIGDKYYNDIIPSKELGMNTIIIHQGITKDLMSDIKADYEINNLLELKEIL